MILEHVALAMLFVQNMQNMYVQWGIYKKFCELKLSAEKLSCITTAFWMEELLFQAHLSPTESFVQATAARGICHTAHSAHVLLGVSESPS